MALIKCLWVGKTIFNIKLIIYVTTLNPVASVNKISCALQSCNPGMVIPWEVAVVVAMVTGDLPLVWADWLVVETELLVEGELVWGRWPAALVIAARRPSGFVPYCTGWNNLIRKNNHVVWMWEYQYNQFTFYKICKTSKDIYINLVVLSRDFFADLMGFIGHGLGRGGGSGPV